MFYIVFSTILGMQLQSSLLGRGTISAFLLTNNIASSEQPQYCLQKVSLFGGML